MFSRPRGRSKPSTAVNRFRVTASSNGLVIFYQAGARGRGKCFCRDLLARRGLLLSSGGDPSRNIVGQRLRGDEQRIRFGDSSDQLPVSRIVAIAAQKAGARRPNLRSALERVDGEPDRPIPADPRGVVPAFDLQGAQRAAVYTDRDCRAELDVPQRDRAIRRVGVPAALYEPQHQTLPSSRSAHVCRVPRLTDDTLLASAIAGTGAS